MEQAVVLIKQGKVIAFPTETFYGLAADPTNHSAIEDLLQIKTRDRSTGIPLIANSLKVLEQWGEISNDLKVREAIQTLINKFWPGPLTLVIKANAQAKSQFHPGIFGPDQTFAIRVSSSKIARELAQACGGLITATSANPKGLSPVKTEEEVRKYFHKMYIVPGLAGSYQNELPPTILSVESFPFRMIREGAIGKELLKEWLAN